MGKSLHNLVSFMIHASFKYRSQTYVYCNTLRNLKGHCSISFKSFMCNYEPWVDKTYTGIFFREGIVNCNDLNWTIHRFKIQIRVHLCWRKSESDITSRWVQRECKRNLKEKTSLSRSFSLGVNEHICEVYLFILCDRASIIFTKLHGN